MQHPIFEGSHYDIGFKWGTFLKSEGTLLLDNIPFPITKNRIDFALSCLKEYEHHFPEIVEEIKGIADGQNCDVNKLYAVLFCMYCIMPGTNCSCFATKIKNGNIVLGRNSDFLTSIEHLYLNIIYKFDGQSYAFNGNSTAFVQMEDGINQHGLSVGLTAVYPKRIQPGINSGMLLRFFLEKCATVEQVIDMIEILPIATSQTFVVADAQNNAILVELSPDNKEIIAVDEEHPFVYSTNMFNTIKMQVYNNLPKDNWMAKERYETMQKYFSKNAREGFSIEKAKEVLSGKHGFMCQYDRRTGKDTVWSVVYEPAKMDIYRAEGNPAQTEFFLDNRLL